MEHKKIVIAGDGAIGKTCLVGALRQDLFEELEDYRPAMFHYPTEWAYDYYDVTVEFWDHPGQEALTYLRQCTYTGTDILLLAFDMSNVTSLENLPSWIEEFEEANTNALIVMVGCKADLWLSDDTSANIGGERQRNFSERCTLAEMQQMALQVGAHAFVCTSAKTGQGVTQETEPDDIAAEEHWLQQIILDLNHTKWCEGEQVNTLCEKQLWLPWVNGVSIALALGVSDPASPLAVLKGNVHLQKMIWQHVSRSMTSLMPMLLSPEAAAQREIEANEKAEARAAEVQREIEAAQIEEARAKLSQEKAQKTHRQLQRQSSADGCCTIG